LRYSDFTYSGGIASEGKRQCKQALEEQRLAVERQAEIDAQQQQQAKRQLPFRVNRIPAQTQREYSRPKRSESENFSASRPNNRRSPIGELNKEIASELGTVEQTIKVHRAHTMEKMGVKSVAELVRLVERCRINGRVH
jgi:DNA-binding NarL/FixJ family response regulator